MLKFHNFGQPVDVDNDGAVATEHYEQGEAPGQKSSVGSFLSSGIKSASSLELFINFSPRH